MTVRSIRSVLTLANIEDARSKGVKVRNYCEVVGLDVKDYSIEAVRFKDHRSGIIESVNPSIVVNAAGAWSSSIAGMAGQKLALRIDKGTMVVLNGRLCRMLVNRLRLPADGDIVVPNHSSTIIGTTSSGVTSGDDNSPTEVEVSYLLRETAKFGPGHRQRKGGPRLLRGPAIDPHRRGRSHCQPQFQGPRPCRFGDRQPGQHHRRQADDLPFDGREGLRPGMSEDQQQ